MDTAATGGAANACAGPADVYADPPSRSPGIRTRSFTRGQWQVFGLAGTSRKHSGLLVAVASRTLPGSSALDGGRSRSPLRGSPGFPPGSLLRRSCLAGRANQLQSAAYGPPPDRERLVRDPESDPRHAPAVGRTADARAGAAADVHGPASCARRVRAPRPVLCACGVPSGSLRRARAVFCAVLVRCLVLCSSRFRAGTATSSGRAHGIRSGLARGRRSAAVEGRLTRWWPGRRSGLRAAERSPGLSAAA